MVIYVRNKCWKFCLKFCIRLRENQIFVVVRFFGRTLYSGRFTHINGYPSAAGPVQTSESSPVRDRHSTVWSRKDDKD